MYELGPLNKFPFNTTEVNAGWVELVTLSASSSCIYVLNGSASYISAIVASATTSSTLGCSADVPCTLTSTATVSSSITPKFLIREILSTLAITSSVITPLYFYNDGLPINITNWDPSQSITTILWDDALPTVGDIITLER